MTHIKQVLPTYTLEHFMWLQPSFFWMGLLQLGHGLELVTSHRKLAASSVSPELIRSSSGLISATLLCHSTHCSQPEGECASPRHSLNMKVVYFIHSHELTPYSLNLFNLTPKDLWAIGVAKKVLCQQFTFYAISNLIFTSIIVFIIKYISYNKYIV